MFIFTLCILSPLSKYSGMLFSEDGDAAVSIGSAYDSDENSNAQPEQDDTYS